MIDELREEEIIKKVGGRFRLTTLIRKRMEALKQRSHPMASVDGSDTRETQELLQLVIREIMEERITLDTDMNVQENTGDDLGVAPEIDSHDQ